MERNQHIRKIVASAQPTFSNYFGGNSKQPVGVTPLPGHSYMNGQGGGQVPVKFNPEIKRLTFDIQNTDNLYDLAAPLFSANEQIAVPYNGVACTITGNTAQSAKGIIINLKQYSIPELRNEIITKPSVIQGVRYNFGDNTQLKKNWVHRFKEGSNITTNDDYDPSEVRDLKQLIESELDDPNYRLELRGGTTLFVVLAPGKSIKLTFKVAVQVELANALYGESALQKNGPTFQDRQDVRLF